MTDPRLTGELPFPRWLIVVRRDRTMLYEQLARAFEFSERVDVLVDRRVAAGRSRPEPIRSERRRRLTARERALWQHVGFRVIYIAGSPAGEARGETPQPAAGSHVERPPGTPS